MLASIRSRLTPRRAVFIICAVVIVIQCVVVTQRRAKQIGDFDVSREFGRRFLAGEYLYAGGLHYPYLPTAALAFSPLALVPPSVGFILRYAAAIASLWLALRLMQLMVAARHPAVNTHAFWIAVAAVVLAAHYILRDLDDSGPHLILVAIMVAGMYAAWCGRELTAGICFGFATTIKATHGLFLPFLLWKREWRLAGMSAAATVAWILLPMLWMGPASWWDHHLEWTRTAIGSVGGSPTQRAAESERRIINQSLRQAIVRYATDDVEGEVSPGSKRADTLATLGVVTLLALCAIAMRRRYAGATDPAWVLEASAVLVLALLLSPVAWLQHMVLVIPGLYLVVAEHLAIRSLGRPAMAAMIGYAVLALLVNRELLGGKANHLAVLSYSPHTIALLLLLAVLLLRRPTAGANVPTSAARP